MKKVENTQKTVKVCLLLAISLFGLFLVSNQVFADNEFSVSCSASPSTAKVGDWVTFTAYPSGGTGSYTDYYWYGEPQGAAAKQTSVRMTSVGTKSARVQVTSGTQTAFSSYCYVTVSENCVLDYTIKKCHTDGNLHYYDTCGNERGVAQTCSNGCSNNQCNVAPVPSLSVSCSASPSTAKVGDWVTFTAYPSGGTGSYTDYYWYGEPQGAA
ncbi:MAG: hypothetical protein PHN39_01775, partial [Candidatus Pacebacteria bacterium]|nr:hypothetical protein [Candidatus Paceibacterota bacterium]